MCVHIHWNETSMRDQHDSSGNLNTFKALSLVLHTQSITVITTYIIENGFSFLPVTKSQRCLYVWLHVTSNSTKSGLRRPLKRSHWLPFWLLVLESTLLLSDLLSHNTSSTDGPWVGGGFTILWFSATVIGFIVRWDIALATQFCNNIWSTQHMFLVNSTLL